MKTITRFIAIALSTSIAASIASGCAPVPARQRAAIQEPGLGVLYPDGGYTQGIGISPDVEVPLTVAEFTGGKDVIYERALQYLAANP